MKNKLFGVLKIIILSLIVVLVFMPMVFVEKFNSFSMFMVFVIIILLSIVYKKSVWLEVLKGKNIIIKDISLEILKRIGDIKKETKVYVIPKEHLGGEGVICYGIIRPKIIISDKVYNKLSQEELDAIILHEYYHILKKTGLNYNFLTVISLMCSYMAIFFLQNGKNFISLLSLITSFIMLRLATVYKLSDEFKADEFSLKQNKNAEVLVSALNKIQELIEIDASNNKFKLKLGRKTHPDLEERIYRITKLQAVIDKINDM